MARYTAGQYTLAFSVFMVARLCKILLLVQFILGVVIAWAFMRAGGLPLAAAALLATGIILALRMLITANNFRLSWRIRSPTPPEHRLGPHKALRLFLEEFRSTMLTSSWTMPFFAFTCREAPGAQGLPVLLIHGYGCNSGYWHDMSRRLREAGITHHAVSLEPMFGDIDNFVPALQRAITELHRASGGKRVVLVAHSMGGLVARAWLCAHGAGHIARIITLGTPHRGTGLAGFGLGDNCTQMTWDPDAGDGCASEWLRQLEAREDPGWRKLFVSVYTHQDNIIAPQSSSHLAGARNIAISGVGHVALGLNARVQDLVIAEIRAAEAADKQYYSAISSN